MAGAALAMRPRACYTSALRRLSAAARDGEHRRVVVIGSGPAGYTAALYAARAMLAPLVLAGRQHGGQLMLTSDVENFPGYEASVAGPEMMGQLRRQAERFGAAIVEEDCAALPRLADGPPFAVEIAGGSRGGGGGARRVTADALVIATGAEARWLGARDEERVRGRGVST